MKKILTVLAIVMLGCESKQQTDFAQDEDFIKNEIVEFHGVLKKAYNGSAADTDSLYDAYFDKSTYYVAPWGTSEPIDSTKRRLKNAVPRVKDYDNRVEVMSTKVYGDGGYIFFVLRQEYTIDGRPLEEYLPTTFVMERRDGNWLVVHAQRSTDVETMMQWFPPQTTREDDSKGRK